MSNTKHAPEPWKKTSYDTPKGASGTDVFVSGEQLIATFKGEVGKANAARIVACVNSAKFVSNEWLQSNSVNALIESERESKMKVEALLHALKTIQLRYNESFLKEHQELIAKAISYATN